MSNNAQNVTASTPKVGGAIYRAPKGTTLPTDASTALGAAFKNLGYISEDGATESTSIDTASIKSWGRDTVLTSMTGKEKKFKWKMIESLNDEVMKMVYGDSNVTGTVSAGLTIKENSIEDDDHCYVIEMVLRGGIAERIVIPAGRITALSDVVYKDGEPVGYETEITCTPDDKGNTNYKYLKG